MKKLQNRYENEGSANKNQRRRRPWWRVMGLGLSKLKKLETRVMGSRLALPVAKKKASMWREANKELEEELL